MWKTNQLNKFVICRDGKIIREIDFLVNSTNYIVGDIEKENEDITSNSLGKSSLIKLIDLIYGAKKDKKSNLENMPGLTIKAYFEGGIEVERVLGNFNEIYLNGEKISIKSYTEKIRRGRIASTSLIHREDREKIIQYNSKGKDIENYKIFFKLLKLEKYFENVENYYSLVSEIEEKIKLKKEYNTSDDVFIQLEKEIEILEDKLKKIEDNNEETIKNQIEEQYININDLEKKRKKLKFNIANIESDNRMYIENLEKFNEKNSGEKFIEEFYKLLNEVELSLIKRKAEEVEEYHRLHNEETIERITRQIQYNKEKLSILKEKLLVVEEKIPKIKEILDSNSEIEMLFKSYSELSHDLIVKKEEYSLKTVSNKLAKEINLYEIQRAELVSKILDEKEELQRVFKEYVDYSNELVNYFYNKQLSSSLSIGIKDLTFKKSNNTKYPYEIKFNVDKDNGEGISNVKNIIIDLIAFKFNEEIIFQIWDSKSFNGIDPLQIEKIFKEINRICTEGNKQAIVAINKFQINKKIEKEIEDEVILKLSNESTLFGFDF